MKKTALVLSLSVLTLFDEKSYLSIQHNNKNIQIEMSNLIPDIDANAKNSFVPLQNEGMKQIKFIDLEHTLGKIDIATYQIDTETQIVLNESLHYNINVKGYNKLIGNFNSLYSIDNVALMRNYQDYADKNCMKIYGCVGSEINENYDWKIIKFLPNPEKCNLENTITMSNVKLQK